MQVFIYIILAYLAGFLGIALGLFIHILQISNQKSFGVPLFTPYIPLKDLSKNQGLYLNPVWKRELRSSFLNTKKPIIENHLSMKWRQRGK